MERYLIFGFNAYYPCGGFKDLQAVTNDLGKVHEYIEKNHYDLVDEDRQYTNGVFEYFYVLDTVSKKWYEATTSFLTRGIQLVEDEDNLEYKVL